MQLEASATCSVRQAACSPDRRLEANRPPAQGTMSLNWELFDRPWRRQLGGPGRADEGAARRTAPEPGELAELRADARQTVRAEIVLWQKTKNDLVEEMSTALQMPGWGNSFTQPIAARIEMLCNGRADAGGRQGIRHEPQARSGGEPGNRRGACAESKARPTCFRIRWWARGTSRSRSTAAGRPGTALTWATSRTWWR